MYEVRLHHWFEDSGYGTLEVFEQLEVFVNAEEYAKCCNVELTPQNPNEAINVEIYDKRTDQLVSEYWLQKPKPLYEAYDFREPGKPSVLMKCSFCGEKSLSFAPLCCPICRQKFTLSYVDSQRKEWTGSEAELQLIPNKLTIDEEV